MLEAFIFVFGCLLPPALMHHFILIPKNLLAFLVYPIDGYCCWNGKRLLGSSKTWRGLVFMGVGSSLMGIAISFLIPKAVTALILPSPMSGLILGLVYSVAEFPTSFVKRQLKVSSSGQAKGLLAIGVYFLDQIDSITGVVLGSFLVIRPELLQVNILFFGWCIGVLLHIGIDTWLYLKGYKKNLVKPFFLS